MKRRNFLASAQKKSYQTKRFRNPEASTKKTWRIRVIFGVATTLFFAASIPFALAYAPVFTFNHIEVNGLTSIPDYAVTGAVYEQMEKKWFKILPQTNQFYFQAEEVLARLNEEFDFSKLEIAVEGRGVYIEAEERIVELVWITGDTFYFLDLDGSIARELEEGELVQIEARLKNTADPLLEGDVRKLQPHMPIIQDMSDESVDQDQQVLDEFAAENLIQVDKGFRSHQIEPVIYEIDKAGEKSLSLISSESYKIYLTTDQHPETIINNLSVVLTDYQERLEEISYIDLRFGNHIYIK